MRDARSKCQKFASAIQAIFQEGLHVDPESRHFILSTVSISDICQLEEFITDPGNCESDSLMELIYFPDESVQLRLEDRLELEAFEQKDEQTVLEHVLSGRGKTLVRFDGLETVLTIKTPATGAQAFLARLNIARHLDPELIRVINQAAGTTQGKRYRVWLRNMVREPRKRDVAFLKDLFLKMDTLHDSFHETVNFSLRFLEETPGDADPLQSLMAHKQRCLQHLQQNDRLEAYRRDHNIETLLAHGIRIPHMDKQALLLQVALADDICLALFNRSI